MRAHKTTAKPARDEAAIMADARRSLLPALTGALRQTRALKKELEQTASYKVYQEHHEDHFGTLASSVHGTLAAIEDYLSEDITKRLRETLRETHESVAREVAKWQRQAKKDAEVAS